MKKFVKLDFSVREVVDSNNFTQFKIEPLVQGFGSTLGNSLRRVLLSSILGAAVYAYKIDGVEQEFQNLSGCSESVPQISLNIQKIIVTVDENVFVDEKEKITLTLNAKGSKKILAKDIELPAGVKIINGDQEIVNIVKPGVDLAMTFFVIQGRGFSNFQDNKHLTDNQIGFITVSSNFSSIKNVAFKVEEIKIGQQDVSESLVLDIQTNGTASPMVCLAKAAQILISHLNYFVDLGNRDLSTFTFEDNEESWNETPKVELMNLDFSERTTNALRSEGINYLSDLKQKTKSELLKIKNLGQVSLKEIVEKLQDEFKITLEN